MYPFGQHIGLTTDAEAAGDGSLIAIMKRLRTLLGGTLAVREATAPASAAHVNAPAANTAAVITLAATVDKKHYLPRVVWSYDAVPTGGRLTITDDGNTVFDISITADGPGVIDLGIESAAVNKALVITLAAGGAGVTGKVNIPGARTA